MEGVDWIDFLRTIDHTKFRHVELRVDNVDKDSYIFNKHLLSEVKNAARNKNLTISIHSLVGVNLGEKVSRIRQISEDILCEVMEAGEYMDALWITTHLGSCGFTNVDVEKKFSRLDIVILPIKWFSTLFRRNNRKTSLYLQYISAVDSILYRSSDFKIKLALENMPRYLDVRGNCRLGDSAPEFEYIFSKISSSQLKFIFDLGHARVNTSQPEEIKKFIVAVQQKLIGMHIHWNNTLIDSHSPLTIIALDELRSIGCTCLLCNPSRNFP